MIRPLRVLLVLPVLAVTLQAQRCIPEGDIIRGSASLPSERYRILRERLAPKLKVYEYRGQEYALIGNKVARPHGIDWEVAYDPDFRLTEAVINRGRHVRDISSVDVEITHEQPPPLKPGAGVTRNPYLDDLYRGGDGGGH